MAGDRLLKNLMDGFLLARQADGYAKGTLDQYEWAIERLIFVVGNKDITEITIEDLRQYMTWIQTEYISKGGKPNTLSPTSVFHAWKAIHAFYAWLNTEYNIERIDRKLAKPKFSYPEVTPFSEEEIKALLKAAERSRLAHTETRRSFTMRRPTAKRDLAIIMILLDTGIRIGELTRLQIADVSVETSELHIQPHRSGLKSRPRTIPLGVQTRRVLWRYLATRELKHPDAWLFTSQDERQLTPNAIQHVLHEIGERAGIAKVHPHRFRHTFAIEYLRNGGDIFTLKRILGHSSLKTVEYYLPLAQGDVKNAHRKASPVDHWRL